MDTARGLITGVVLADQVKCVDWRARGADFANQAPPRTVADVLAKLNVLLAGVP